MNSESLKVFSKSDKAYIEDIGKFIRAERINQNKTQADLALHAGVSRKSISQFESGKVSISLLTFIQILRSLKLLHKLSAFEFVKIPSPILLAKGFIEERQRARKKKKEIKKTNKRKSDW